jgi:hypothetical protein
MSSDANSQERHNSHLWHPARNRGPARRSEQRERTHKLLKPLGASSHRRRARPASSALGCPCPWPHACLRCTRACMALSEAESARDVCCVLGGRVAAGGLHWLPGYSLRWSVLKLRSGFFLM